MHLRTYRDLRVYSQMHNSCFSNIVFGIFTAEGRYNVHTPDGKYIFKERESFDGRNILKVSMSQSESEGGWHVCWSKGSKQAVLFSITEWIFLPLFLSIADWKAY